MRLILRVSSQVFAERGFEATSVREISRASGVSLSGLYYYFEGKQHLLYLIQSAAFTFVLDNLEARLASATDPTERLRILVLNHIEYFLAHPNEMKVLSHEEEALDEPYRERVQAIKRRYYALAREIFESLTAGALTPGFNSRIAVLSLFGMMNWPYKWYRPGIDPDAQDLTATIVGIFLHGVLPSAAGARAAYSSGVGARDCG